MRYWIFAALLLAVAVPAALALEPIQKTRFGDLAVSGYDPVAYFEDGQPIQGKKDFTHAWKGATWRFATASHRDLFAADPESYAPQYGGYCAFAVSKGYTASTDPEAWTIVDGKLYLNYSKKVREQWMQDIPGNIAKADKNWPDLLAAD